MAPSGFQLHHVLCSCPFHAWWYSSRRAPESLRVLCFEIPPEISPGWAWWVFRAVLKLLRSSCICRTCDGLSPCGIPTNVYDVFQAFPFPSAVSPFCLLSHAATTDLSPAPSELLWEGKQDPWGSPGCWVAPISDSIMTDDVPRSQSTTHKG